MVSAPWDCWWGQLRWSMQVCDTVPGTQAALSKHQLLFFSYRETLRSGVGFMACGVGSVGPLWDPCSAPFWLAGY